MLLFMHPFSNFVSTNPSMKQLCTFISQPYKLSALYLLSISVFLMHGDVSLKFYAIRGL